MAYPTQENVTTFDHLQPDGSVITFERTGECTRCGECCKGDPFSGDLGAPVVEGYCPLFELLEGKGNCSNRQHPYYLSGCNVWPTHPDQLLDKPSCTYVFSRVE